jgi:hypothetical protein
VSDELDILKSVVARLEATGIPSMVTGSMAANFYATPRMMDNIVLVVERRQADVGRIVALFQDE